MQHRFADRLAWDRPRIDRRSADHLQVMDQGGRVSKFRRLNRGGLSRRPGTNHDEIVLFHGLPREYITVAIMQSSVDARSALCHDSENSFVGRTAVALEERNSGTSPGPVGRPEASCGGVLSACGSPSWPPA